jgi:hypothetical protein
MLSKDDDCRAKALERPEPVWRPRDAEARLTLLQDLARHWWRMTELRRISDSGKSQHTFPIIQEPISPCRPYVSRPR